jgi:hypothetical protein
MGWRKQFGVWWLKAAGVLWCSFLLLLSRDLVSGWHPRYGWGRLLMVAGAVLTIAALEAALVRAAIERIRCARGHRLSYERWLFLAGLFTAVQASLGLADGGSGQPVTSWGVRFLLVFLVLDAAALVGAVLAAVGLAFIGCHDHLFDWLSGPWLARLQRRAPRLVRDDTAQVEIRRSRDGRRLLAVTGDTLAGADLSGQDLRDASLYGAYLPGADLTGADLRCAALNGADLRGACLRGADLRGAFLYDTDLRDADLCATDLRGATLRDVNLSEADLTGADLRGTLWTLVPAAHLIRTDLAGVRHDATTRWPPNLAEAWRRERAASPPEVVPALPPEGRGDEASPAPDRSV